MAGEIQIAYGTSGSTLYAVVRSATGTVWNTAGSALEAYNGANWTDYDIALTEQGTSGYYAGDFPAAAAGFYNVEVRVRAGGGPATTDAVAGAGDVEWSGSAVLPLSAATSILLNETDGNLNVNVRAWNDTGVVTGTPPDTAGVRTAVGLASANLDTQLGDLPTAAENADALLGRTATGGANGGRTVSYFLQGGFNRAVRTSTAFTVYSTDDLTILATGPLTEDGTLNPITAVDPT